ncbi:hypothetical protein RchiOBHm_Chr5g0027931 [Rosa chinensis]|uniref:Uncharacterized protein n=1 Tax=Rosa chinensis TaxID=74649 RepID=A0A2P6Q9A6_ROSCH|nr:hypothetical protein RchiOBHm_Chr5g0027931 [Rosa chinensis]
MAAHRLLQFTISTITQIKSIFHSKNYKETELHPIINEEFNLNSICRWTLGSSTTAEMRSERRSKQRRGSVVLLIWPSPPLGSPHRHHFSLSPQSLPADPPPSPTRSPPQPMSSTGLQEDMGNSSIFLQ